MFVTTLPIIFTFIHLFSELEATIFLIAIFFLVYVYVPEPDKYWHEPRHKNFYQLLHAAWLGNITLARAFWVFFILVNGVIFYIDYRINNITYTIASWKTVHGMIFLPIVWWTVAVWRCSTNTTRKLYAAAARTITIYLFLEIILRFYISTQHPETIFDCRLLAISYGDCF